MDCLSSAATGAKFSIISKAIYSTFSPPTSCISGHFSPVPVRRRLLIQFHSFRFIFSICNGDFAFIRGVNAVIPPPGRGKADWLLCRSFSTLSGGCGGDDRAGGGYSGGDDEEVSGGGGRGDVSGGEETSASTDLIILDVGGMTCGGCASNVKIILESQLHVSSASVNLTTETAVVWPTSEIKVMPNWKKQLGETLAKHLTACGFKSTPRDFTKDNNVNFFERKIKEKHDHLKESGHELAVSWALCAVCLFGHLSQFLGANASWVHAFHSPGFHLSLSLFTLLGPGRQLIFDGLRSLFKGIPNMNTLVGIGALSSFAVSSLATLIPRLGWRAFFEEPIMLIAFVLLGRNLEQRAKIKATSDMTSLLSILPSKARLLINDAGGSDSTVQVPCNHLSVGDKIVILPGDRVPVDGIVRAGRSTVDESSMTGEPLPVMKLPETEVVAGSVNLNGTLIAEVRRSGDETAISHIIRLVEEAQNREAPVQRLADKVAGHFTYGVMALSAATFMFWNHFGAQVIPIAVKQGSPISLALQLSCTVLVIACPCALGLATPTAVLVGTSLGATKGLLFRGGNVLEMCARVKAVVFDKTGTLTIGKPMVKNVVMPPACDTDTNSELTGVELNTIHPIGKAIVYAAQLRNCESVKATDGTFLEEPGSGAVAVVEDKKVSVGTLQWVQRHGVVKNPFQEADDLNNQSVVYVGIDGILAGLIYIEDQIRHDAAHVVQSLSKNGISVYMLSGDRRNAAEYVASMIGIPKEKVFCGVKPFEKKKFITDLQKDGTIVAMVGDGINDAAALASSHVGVAMGGDVGAASEVSSVVLMRNTLSQLVEALELSQVTMKTVKQNLWWAFAYNIIGIPIAAGAMLPFTGTMLTPSIAGGLMGLSSLGVMTNSLLLRFKFSTKQKLKKKNQVNDVDQGKAQFS